MMNGSNTTAVISARSIPLLPGVMELATSGVIPGGTRDNFAFTSPNVEYDDGLSGTRRLILNDAQTSGGLLISVAEERAEALVDRLRAKGVGSAAVIGEVTPPDAKRIRVGL
jgi:selenide,water dikinase